ncbi:hypothetical protein [Actinoplanes sp. NPDC026670]|uniref:hypothetical protein n=1 Tax=Actinoplanes sp. NPDC026670 TaxID=3154700 RepID=UPI0034036F95
MSSITKIAVGVAAVAVLGAGAAAVFGGVFPTSSDTHPPCEELPTRAEAATALDRNQALATEITGLGKGISVTVGTPCPEGQDRALIQVTYRTDAEHEAVGDLLGRRDGFGVPVYLVED